MNSRRTFCQLSARAGGCRPRARGTSPGRSPSRAGGKAWGRPWLLFLAALVWGSAPPRLLGGHLDETNRWVYTLSVSAGAGGAVTSPGEGAFNYYAGTAVGLTATPEAGYSFSCWSGSAVDAGQISDPTQASTSVTIDDDCTVQANFIRPAQVTLSVSAGAGGVIVTPAQGTITVARGTTVAVEAVASDARHRFQAWSGSAVSKGKVGDPRSAQTSVLVDADYALSAQFVEQSPGACQGYSLGQIDYENPTEFTLRTSTNNTPEAVFVERVDDPMPGLGGVVRMRLIQSRPARLKVRFAPCGAERILLRFRYLQETRGATEIVAYLSDVPEILDPADPQRARHYVEIGRIPLPPAGRPGSWGSGRWGLFENRVLVGALTLSRGTWIELEFTAAPWPGAADLALQESVGTASADSATLIDDCAAGVDCSGYCMDFDDSKTVDPMDFMLAIAAMGLGAAPDRSGTNGHYCMDGAFTDDGYIDPYDMRAWAWALGDPQRVTCRDCPKSLCRSLPLIPAGSLESSGMNSPAPVEISRGPATVALGTPTADLLVLGKTRMSNAYSDLVGDCLYLFDDQPAYVAAYASSGSLPTRCNGQLARGPGNDLYLVNTEKGVLRIDGSVQTVVPPGQTTVAREPRYQRPATIYVGIQGEGSSSSGRPILDVAVGADGRLYVVPVVVRPSQGEPYLAAAQLELDRSATPPYHVVMLYDEPRPPNDNQYRDNLREVEVDRAGNVYVLNVHALNESCILWKYAAGATLRCQWRLDFLGPASTARVQDPLALHVSEDGQRLYVASGQYHSADPNSAVVYELSALDGTLVRALTIRGMQLVSAITEARGTGTLWVAGFSMPGVREWQPTPLEPSFEPDPFEPFYVPFLARVPPGVEVVTAACVAAPDQHKLALPTAVVWAGP